MRNYSYFLLHPTIGIIIQHNTMSSSSSLLTHLHGLSLHGLSPQLTHQTPNSLFHITNQCVYSIQNLFSPLLPSFFISKSLVTSSSTQTPSSTPTPNLPIKQSSISLSSAAIASAFNTNDTTRRKKEREGSILDWILLWITYMHAIIVLLIGGAVLLTDIAPFHLFRSLPLYLLPQLDVQHYLLIFSSIFYLLASFLLFVTGSSSLHYLHLTHHLVCLCAILPATYYHLDQSLLVTALVIGEMSTPPVVVQQMLTLYKRSILNHNPVSTASSQSFHRYIQHICVMTAVSLAKTATSIILSPFMTDNRPLPLSTLHLLVFSLTRLLSLHIVAHSILPLSNLLTTRIVSLMLVGINAGYLIVYVAKVRGKNVSGSNNTNSNSGIITLNSSVRRKSESI